MINLTNQILELQNGKKFFVVRQATFRKKTYFFAAEVTDDETLRILAKNIKLD